MVRVPMPGHRADQHHVSSANTGGLVGCRQPRPAPPMASPPHQWAGGHGWLNWIPKRGFARGRRTRSTPEGPDLPLYRIRSGWWISANIGTEDLLRRLKRIWRLTVLSMVATSVSRQIPTLASCGETPPEVSLGKSAEKRPLAGASCASLKKDPRSAIKKFSSILARLTSGSAVGAL